GEAGRSAGRAGDEVRTSHQPDHCTGARSPGAADTARPCRRGDRMIAAMKRREFITLLGGTAAAWPLAARAQQREKPRHIGVLMALAADDPESSRRLTAFVQGLQELGWSEGRNVRIDVRWSAGDAARMRVQAAELIVLAPDVVF